MKKKKLFWQLFPSYLFIATATLITLVIASLFSFRTFYYAKTQEDLEIRAKLVGSQIQSLLQENNLISLQKKIEDLGKVSNTRFTIIVPNGTVIADSHDDPKVMSPHHERSEVVGAIKKGKGVAVRYSDTINETLMYYAFKYQFKDEQSVIIRVSIPLTAIKQTLKNIYLKVLLASTWLLTAIALISWWLARRMSKPLEKIRQQAKNLANGDFSKQIVFRDRDPLELYQLGMAMNELSIDLDKKIKTIVMQNSQQQAIFSSMAEGVLALDQTGKIHHLNHAASRILNLPSSNYENSQIEDILDHDPLSVWIQKTLKNPSRDRFQVALPSADNKIIEAHSNPLCSPQGENIGIVLVLSDVTQLKKLESLRKDFVANVSHELRTPLTSIQGYAEILINSDPPLTKNHRKFLEVIHRHALRLEKIIEDLLSLSRIEKESEDQQIELQIQNLQPTLKAAIEICEVAARKRNIQIHLDTTNNVYANINSPLLEQALVNLLSNAIKYSRENSRVSITTKELENEICLSVRDEGIGIAREELPRLFERFYRVDKARSRDMGGTGLGLSIVKHVSLAHRGRVAVNSTVGVGSVFSIYLPKPNLTAETEHPPSKNI